MEVVIRIESDLLLAAVCLVVLINARLHALRLPSGRDRMEALVCVVMALLILDALAWAASLLHNRQGALLRSLVLCLYYAFNDFEPFLWAVYVRTNIYKGKKHLRAVFALPMAASFVLLIANPFAHTLFRFNALNVYTRGSLLYVNTALCCFYLLYALALPLVNRERLPRRSVLTFVLFCLPPILGAATALTLPGINLMWACSALSLLAMHLTRLSERMCLDYLTGLSNRMQSDIYLTGRIRRGKTKTAFAGIMIDIDNFKQINDQFGHHAGDMALESTAKLLKKCFGHDAFLCRYGGDEFLIFIEASDRESLRKKVGDLRAAFPEYCKAANLEFGLDISIGYDLYNFSRQMSKSEFIRHLDRLMYLDKQAKKKATALYAASAKS